MNLGASVKSGVPLPSQHTLRANACGDVASLQNPSSVDLSSDRRFFLHIITIAELSACTKYELEAYAETKPVGRIDKQGQYARVDGIAEGL